MHAEWERDELSEALEILEDRFWLGHATVLFRGRHLTLTCEENHSNTGASLCVSEKNDTTPVTARSGGPVAVAERVAKLLVIQAGARASSSPDQHKGIRQSPRLSAKSDKSARSDMPSGSHPPKPAGNRLTFQGSGLRRGIGSTENRNRF